MAIYTKTKGNVSLFTSKKCISILMRTSYHISKIMGKSHRDLPILAGHHYYSDPWTIPIRGRLPHAPAFAPSTFSPRAFRGEFGMP